jgi:hypothetical protein
MTTFWQKMSAMYLKSNFKIPFVNMYIHI